MTAQWGANVIHCAQRESCDWSRSSRWGWRSRASEGPKQAGHRISVPIDLTTAASGSTTGIPCPCKPHARLASRSGTAIADRAARSGGRCRWRRTSRPTDQTDLRGIVDATIIRPIKGTRVAPRAGSAIPTVGTGPGGSRSRSRSSAGRTGDRGRQADRSTSARATSRTIPSAGQGPIGTPVADVTRWGWRRRASDRGRQADRESIGGAASGAIPGPGQGPIGAPVADVARGRCRRATS